MRSRFEAFRRADVEWLLASWHPSTRPVVIDLGSNPRWRGLQIVDVVDGLITFERPIGGDCGPTGSLSCLPTLGESGLSQGGTPMERPYRTG